MRLIGSRIPLIVGALALVGLTDCGIYGGGGGGPTADVRGNIEATTPGVGDRDIVVFVYTLKDNEEHVDCTEPELPDKGTQEQTRILQPGETAFEVRNAKAGRLVVVFLLDEPGKDGDGRIDPGDPIAILNDPSCVLDDVPNKYIVEADDIRINFSLEDEDDFPAPGRAEAGSLSEAPE